jgi:hypothetical protein
MSSSMAPPTGGSGILPSSLEQAAISRPRNKNKHNFFIAILLYNCPAYILRTKYTIK